MRWRSRMLILCFAFAERPADVAREVLPDPGPALG
eukprot:CAMPEP_0118869078 /NCGR_PEP_ID=MMETSP1163-20130328/12532_1 /TAXON_ID=124430 /ORGANISM="Phaeomonas parva, Strain CCMP2877" /LENGTH=34 /DNA_ID= /DNA_START= /DNA_END= /DNA_ORIENTATION=